MQLLIVFIGGALFGAFLLNLFYIDTVFRYRKIRDTMQKLSSDVSSIGISIKANDEFLLRLMASFREGDVRRIKELRDLIRDRSACILFEVKRLHGQTMISDSIPNMLTAFAPLIAKMYERENAPKEAQGADFDDMGDKKPDIS